jgi:LacI family transcriptional regulator
MATIQDIAKRANVSKSTVSRVLTGSSAVQSGKREAVMKAMEALNYQPNVIAQSLAGGRSMTIGIVTQNIGSPFTDTIAQGVIAGLAGTGYSPIFVDGQWQQSAESEVIRTLLGRNVDGLVLIGGHVPTDDINKLRNQLPTIAIARELNGWDSQCIHVDNEDAGFRATQHLLDFGHRDIAIVCGIKEHPDASNRLKGYTRALTTAGITLSPELVYQGDFSAQSGVLAVNSWLASSSHFSAIFAANDMVAFGARLALHRHGIRVPHDVSIIGFDDQAESAFMTPPLTTMRQPAAEMGAAGAAAITQLIAGEIPELPELAIELQLRESVARRAQT